MSENITSQPEIVSNGAIEKSEALALLKTDHDIEMFSDTYRHYAISKVQTEITYEAVTANKNEDYKAKWLSDYLAPRIQEEKSNFIVQNNFAAVRIARRAQIGKVWPELPKNPGVQMAGKDSFGAFRLNAPKSDIPTMPELGITDRYIYECKILAALPDDKREEFVATCEENNTELTVAAITKYAKNWLRKKGRETKPATTATIALADAIQWLKQQEPCDLLITDPPYMTDVEDIAKFAADWLPVALSKVKSTGRAFVFIGAYPEELLAYLSVRQPRQILVWTYNNTIGPLPKESFKQNWQAILYYTFADTPALNGESLNERMASQTVNAPDARIADRYHAWEKPLDLADILINQATNEGDSILDPFAGTGTFLLSAARLGRIASGCDNAENMINIAQERGCVLRKS